MRVPTRASLAAVLLALFLQPVSTQRNGSQRTPIDLTKLGPQVGQAVPDFRLRDQNGGWRTLESISGPRGAMLVFFRSADW